MSLGVVVGLLHDALKYRFPGNWIDQGMLTFRQCFLCPTLFDMHQRADRSIKH